MLFVTLRQGKRDNRVDEIVIIHSLTREQIGQIVFRHGASEQGEAAPTSAGVPS